MFAESQYVEAAEWKLFEHSRYSLCDSDLNGQLAAGILVCAANRPDGEERRGEVGIRRDKPLPTLPSIQVGWTLFLLT